MGTCSSKCTCIKRVSEHYKSESKKHKKPPKPEEYVIEEGNINSEGSFIKKMSF